jgi:hypothetical protein
MNYEIDSVLTIAVISAQLKEENNDSVGSSSVMIAYGFAISVYPFAN